jgi:hypothetical protein
LARSDESRRPGALCDEVVAEAPDPFRIDALGERRVLTLSFCSVGAVWVSPSLRRCRSG